MRRLLSLRGTFRSLRKYNYRAYFVAAVLSNLGTWIQLVAENWLILKLGGSGLALGITTGLQFLPVLVLSAYGGVVADRADKRRLLTVLQSLMALPPLLLGILIALGQVHIWLVWTAAFLVGIINAFSSPAIQAFAFELAGPDDVTNAVALNSTVATLARAIGPAVGSLVAATAGIAACFLLNAASYGIVVAALLLMRPSELFAVKREQGPAPTLKEGIQYAYGASGLAIVLVAFAVASVLGLNFQVLLPLVVTHVLSGNIQMYGLVMSDLGLGMTIGSLLVAAASTPTLSRVASLTLLFGLANALAGFAHNVVMVFATTFVLGIAATAFTTTCSVYLMKNAADTMRGRIMGFYILGLLGTAPIGGPLIGWIAQATSPGVAFISAAIGCGIAGVFTLVMVSRSLSRTMSV
ncbi:MAG: MFS transporter [Firmicutes bacterium]|nr:MFS transporter [Bacillota bacterium]